MYMYVCVHVQTVHACIHCTCTCTYKNTYILFQYSVYIFHYMYTLYYMKIHVPSMLAISVETINKQTQQTNKQPCTCTCTYMCYPKSHNEFYVSFRFYCLKMFCNLVEIVSKRYTNLSTRERDRKQ